MSLRPNLEDQEALAATRERRDERLASTELLFELAFGFAFLACVAGLWVLGPPGGFAVPPALMCVAVLVVASNVEFDTPLGFTVATQLAFVPLVFALPAALVPLVTVAALVFTRLPQVFAGRVPYSRLLRSLNNAWFSVGAVAVFALAHTAPSAAGPLLLAAALGGQIGLDVAVSGIRNWVERGASIVAQLREMWVYAIDLALSVIGLLVAEDLHRQPIVTLAPLPLLALLYVFARERANSVDRLLELNTAYRGTALVLGDVIEADDGYTGEHCKSVVRLAIDVSVGLDLDAESRRNVEFAALLHDVGKIAIPKEIINKPGKLTPDEFKVIETHTVEGQKMLDRIGGFMAQVGMIVRSHHERWDGGGYPDGIAGAAIPVEARIITACDSWNAMRTDRSYRKALPYEVAVGELRDNAGGQFDPQIVEVLLRIVEESESPAAVARAQAAHAAHQAADQAAFAAGHQAADQAASSAAQLAASAGAIAAPGPAVTPAT